jgi:copper chaperone CopZ
MVLQKQIWLLLFLAVPVGAPAIAQVNKVTADAKGITWPSCAAVMEIALRRLDGVDKIWISISEQRFQVTYKAGASFQPQDIRGAVAKAGVEVLRFRITARGRVHEEAGKQFLVAGKDKFLLVASPKMPSKGSISIEGTVDDSAEPLQLQISQFKPLK